MCYYIWGLLIVPLMVLAQLGENNKCPYNTEIHFWKHLTHTPFICKWVTPSFFQKLLQRYIFVKINKYTFGHVFSLIHVRPSPSAFPTKPLKSLLKSNPNMCVRTPNLIFFNLAQIFLLHYTQSKSIINHF